VNGAMCLTDVLSLVSSTLLGANGNDTDCLEISRKEKDVYNVFVVKVIENRRAP
jgi:hypothetical protein